jgi:hypothetical protein
MAPADIEQPDLVAVAALDVAETLAHVKIAQESVRCRALVSFRCHSNHNLSRSIMTPRLM